MKIKLYLALILSAWFIASCGGANTQPVVADEPADSTPDLADLLVGADDVFYFDYDRSQIRDEAIDDLDIHAEFILRSIEQDGDFRVTIEGHADERGSISYNQALGNRRAEAVARYFRVKGVPVANIDTISYGEQRPAATGSNEQAWSRNRRAATIYYR